MKLNFINKSALAVAVLGTLASVPARADNLVISPDMTAPAFTASVAGSSKSMLATLFSVTDTSTGGSFQAFCIELLQNMSSGALIPPGQAYTAGSVVTAATQALFNESFASVDLGNKAQVAGFQIALWETLDDSTLTSGSYKGWVGNTGSAIEASALAIADAMLTKVRNGAPYTANFLLTTWSSATSQDLIQAHKVPEPGAALLGALGMGSLAMLRRRRR